MLTISIQFTSISAERLSEVLPPQVQFQVNLSVPSSQPYTKDDRTIIIPFTFTINSIPPVVQYNIRGKAMVVVRDKKEYSRTKEAILEKKQMPKPVIQAIFNNVMAEVIVLSRSLGVPPPLPPIQLPQPRKTTSEQHYSPVQ